MRVTLFNRELKKGSAELLILSLIEHRPRHGYEIMLAIEERRGFRPSPGSIYPALQMLDDGDFVSSREVDGKRIYHAAGMAVRVVGSRAPG